MNNINILKDINSGFMPEVLDIIYLLSIVFGVLIIINKNPIISVLYLIGLFVNISVLLILVGFGFIGLSYILVYVGAVSILFLFILMLINIRISELTNETSNYTPLAILTVMLFYFLVGRILPGNFILLNTNLVNSYIIDTYVNEHIYDELIQYASSKSWDTSLVDMTHITGIGNVMYTNYAILLIIASIILLLAMVGSIVITKKGDKR
uniref:NADH-ubiquinone oxidoreductase chain 6 n=2 Tax=Talaromyces marneffei TaxID=37727 RepID=H9CNT3_TALMQ|nr:NADH dehydrogenase subunit 6 [Talaromyces marneffei]AND96976.1 NADH dehydrogenase subunit 6 [Talaromyces marneffei]AND96992.1 NADH dehydrogenase subunit 6 [Talaromyces marneffei]AND97009.1 NADH dehydrogenase subunit 6 [Talaromyces marneffei]AND97026.1 NADH dehydrogenase subunit 6 [Talaromyces marneffei]